MSSPSAMPLDPPMDALAKGHDPDATGNPRRESILRAAMTLFLDHGYAEVSMDAIATEARVSKRTVYSHFDNKESLFAGVMNMLCCRAMSSKTGEESLLDPEAEPRAVLTVCGEECLRVIITPEAVALLRIVFFETPNFPELGKTYFKNGPGGRNAAVAAYLKGQAERGRLKVDDPDLAAWHFFELVRARVHLACCLGVEKTPGPGKIKRHVAHAVDVFMAAYGA